MTGTDKRALRTSDPTGPSSSETESAHPERHYIVFFRDASWQFTYRGTITGPFSSRWEAIETAIEEARALREPDVEVIVQEHDMQQEIVWRMGNSDANQLAKPGPAKY